MAASFQFAFLGQHHNYVASVTKTVKDGCPLKGGSVTCFRLPQRFENQLKSLAKTRYIYNLRGHDFLSYMGQWTNLENRTGPLSSNPAIYGEIGELNKLAQQDESISNQRANIIANFGPRSGSFFADSSRLNRYRWSNLPAELEDEIQNHVSLNGYGNQKSKIHDVAINALGGWVVQFKRGSQFKWSQGDQDPPLLPIELHRALKEGEAKKWTISKLFLNHQSATEYVLVFSEGQVYVRLHQAFEEKIQPLLQKWADDRKIRAFQMHFTPSCSCSVQEQSLKDAAYYSKRGLFHSRKQSRENVELAYQYLREAHNQDWNNTRIQENYAMALVALRKYRKDPILEGHLDRGERAPPVGGSDLNADFRDQYIHMLATIRSLDGRQIEDQESREEWSSSAEGSGVYPGLRLEMMDSNITAEPLTAVSEDFPVELPAAYRAAQWRG